MGPCGTTNKKITTKCIYKLKPRTHGKQDKLKTRFMVQGFEQCARIDYYGTFALVVKWVTIQTNATLAIHEELWEIFHLDIKTTFLNCDLQEDMFME